jgi:hypothetical protein
MMDAGLLAHAPSLSFTKLLSVHTRPSAFDFSLLPFTFTHHNP